ncbi:hypothetical protein [Prosthecochloris sp.]|uniref:hypothetical protein n=1 Tax=Prosthecochloris sp. TaxID=290513 RepID=UPI0025DE930A|nr:hypothetical protein [Prosthecochloris sp.]
MMIKLLQDLGKEKAGAVVVVSDRHGALLIEQKKAEPADGVQKVKDREAGIKNKLSER